MPWKATPEQTKRWSLNTLVNFVEANGWPPACECGCGEPTRYIKKNTRGVCAAQYVNRAHADWHLGPQKWRMMLDALQEKRAEEGIEFFKFRDALREIKDKNGYTLAEMERICGVRPRGLNYLLYTKTLTSGRTHVTKAKAEHILRRLAGQSTPQTPYEREQLKKALKSHNEAERELLYV